MLQTAADGGRLVAEGIVELMAAQDRALGKIGIGQHHLGPHIAQALRPGTEAGLHGKDAAHGPALPVTLQSRGQDHEAAAFGVDGQALSGQRGQTGQMRRRRQLPGPVFGKAAAQIQAVQLRPRRTVQQGKAHQLRPGPAQGFEVLLIVEPQGPVAHIADAQRGGPGPSSRAGRGARDRAGEGPGAPAGFPARLRHGRRHGPRGGDGCGFRRSFLAAGCPRPGSEDRVRASGNRLSPAGGDGASLPGPGGLVPEIRLFGQGGQIVGDGQHALHVHMAAHHVRQLFQDLLGLRGQLVAAQRGQAHVPLGQGVLAQTGDGPQHGHVRIGGDGLTQNAFVPGRGHLVEHHARQTQAGLEMPHPGHQGRRRAGHLGAVQAEQHRTVQRTGQFGRGAGTAHVHAVEKAAVALQQGQPGPAASHHMAEQGPQACGGQEIGVQVAGLPPGRQREPGRVDIVRAFLEGLDGQPLPGKGPRQAQREQGLAAAPGQGGDADTGGRGPCAGRAGMGRHGGHPWLTGRRQGRGHEKRARRRPVPCPLGTSA